MIIPLLYMLIHSLSTRNTQQATRRRTVRSTQHAARSEQHAARNTQHARQHSSPLFPSSLHPLTYSPWYHAGGCSCDPAIYTSDCDQSSCTAFMTSFLFFDLCLLLCYFITTIHVEVRGRKKSLLWRIILPTAGIACLCMFDLFCPLLLYSPLLLLSSLLFFFVYI